MKYDNINNTTDAIIDNTTACRNMRFNAYVNCCRDTTSNTNR